jgi:DNA-binding transcriptional MerR regulator
MYTVKDVAKIMDVSEHTIRFWAKSGLLPTVKRDDNNVRLFPKKIWLGLKL